MTEPLMTVVPQEAEGKHPLRQPTLETYDIRIARDGTWFHDGRPIRRLELAKLFASVLRRDDAGGYWLVTPAEYGRIVVEDAPFVAVEMLVTGESRDRVLAFRTNLDQWVEAGPDHPIRVDTDPARGEPRPYILVRTGLEARIARAVFYDLVERGTTDGPNGEAEFGVWSRGVFFALGTMPDD